MLSVYIELAHCDYTSIAAMHYWGDATATKRALLIHSGGGTGLVWHKVAPKLVEEGESNALGVADK